MVIQTVWFKTEQEERDGRTDSGTRWQLWRLKGWCEDIKDIRVRGNTSEASVSSTFQEPEPEPALRHQSMCLGGAEARGNLLIVSQVGMLRAHMKGTNINRRRRTRINHRLLGGAGGAEKAGHKAESKTVLALSFSGMRNQLLLQVKEANSFCSLF